MNHPDERATPASARAGTVAPVAQWAALSSRIGRELLAAKDVESMFGVVVGHAVGSVPGTEQAGVIVRRGHRFPTVAARGRDVSLVERLQGELHSGPGLDALAAAGPVWTDDLAGDARWPVFGPRAVESAGIRSVLSYRLFVEADPTVTAALTMYARDPSAFTDASRQTGLLLATHAAHAVTPVAARQKAANLEVALANSQEIGAAIGVVMGLHGIQREQAFDLLRLASQHLHRKLADIAAEVTETGALPQ